jgi:SAM-dependent methyltransferase
MADDHATVPWYEDDRFWDDFYPALFHEGRWRVAPDEAASAIALAGMAPGSEVLDFCCGPGRHSLAFARQGLRVTGVDRTAPYLSRARDRAQKDGLDIEFVEEDVRRFCRAGAYDFAVSLFTSFGYFEDPSDDRTLLQNVFASLRPGGRLLMDMSGKEIVARAFQPRSWSEPEPGLYFLEERSPAEGWEAIDNRWLLIKDGQIREQRYRIRIYSGVELQAVMLSVGFSRVDLFGTLDGAPYDHTARRLVAVGTK